MLPRHPKQYTPFPVPNNSLDLGVFHILVGLHINVNRVRVSGSSTLHSSQIRSRSSTSDEQTDKMDVTPHVRAPVQHIAL
jgi:hypothetical protein